MSGGGTTGIDMRSLTNKPAHTRTKQAGDVFFFGGGVFGSKDGWNNLSHIQYSFIKREGVVGFLW